LAEDIFRYNGMGCRSVSLLFLPEGYDVKRLANALSDALPLRFSTALSEKPPLGKDRAALSDRPLLSSSSAALPQAVTQTGKMNPKYIGNYRQTRGLITVLGQDFIDGGYFVMVNEMEFPTALSAVNYAFYSDIEEVRGWLSANNGRVQAVVSRSGALEGLEGLSPGVNSNSTIVGQPDFQQARLSKSDLRQSAEAGLGKLCSGQFTQARFGQAQHPAPWDYPDCCDVIEFLNNN
jgi:hypothetical protein